MIILLHGETDFRAAPDSQDNPVCLPRPVVAEIGAVLLVLRADETLQVVLTGSDLGKQAAMNDLLADFDVSAISDLEDTVMELVATATDGRGHVDEKAIRREFQMRAYRRACKRFEQRSDEHWP
jgi:hypothetical protein